MVFLVPGVLALALLAGAASTLLGACGPFTDVTDPAFCPGVLEIFFLGITTGTTPTTYDPTSSVTRLQMAAFLSREADRVLQRRSRRAALDQFWTPQDDRALKTSDVGIGASSVRSDGADLWVANQFSNTVTRVSGRDGSVVGTWTGATQAYQVLVAAGRIFAAGRTFPGSLHRIDPRQAPGAVTIVASNLGNFPAGIAYDGTRIWTTNDSSVSIVTPGAALPWTVTTVTTGFTAPRGVLFDGANVWITNADFGHLLKLDASGGVLQTVTVVDGPQHPLFDGTNIWVPSPLPAPGSVTVVRASNGAVLATLTGNGLNSPFTAAFDGQRVLFTNNGGNSVSLWKAADLTPIGSFTTGASSGPMGSCSDGIYFWVTLAGLNKLARF